jgi:hypothetical protein
LVATAVYCAGRLFVDAFRADPWVTSGGFHVVQVVCLAAVLVSLSFLAYYSEGEE